MAAVISCTLIGHFLQNAKHESETPMKQNGQKHDDVTRLRNKNRPGLNQRQPEAAFSSGMTRYRASGVPLE